MNTKGTLIIVVIIVVGLAAYLYFRSPVEVTAPAETETSTTLDTQKTMDSSATQSAEQTVPESGTGSLANLMNMGVSMACDFNYDAEGDATVVSTTYIDGERIRVDSEMQQGGEVYTSHTIMDNGMVYSWSQSAFGNVAVKFKEVKNETTGEYESADGSRSFDFNEEVSYSCRPWSVDETLFTPPSDVEFRDLQDLMQGMGAGQ